MKPKPLITSSLRNIYSLFLLVPFFLLASCERDSDLENAAEDVGDALEEAAEDVAEKLPE